MHGIRAGENKNKISYGFSDLLGRQGVKYIMYTIVTKFSFRLYT